MASTRPLHFLFFSVLLFCIFKFTPLSQYLVSPKQVNTFLLLNVAFYTSKICNNDVFPVVGLTAQPNYRIWSPYPMLINEQSVVVLTEKNFSNFLTKNQHVMVVFYSSRCSWRKRLSPESSAAAMKREGNLVLAKVDTDKEKLLAKKYKIGNYPVIYFFYYGLVDEYYVDEPILLPAETRESKKRAFIAKNVRQEKEEVPRRSDERFPWKVDYQVGVMKISPVQESKQPFGQSTNVVAVEEDLKGLTEVRAEPEAEFNVTDEGVEEESRRPDKKSLETIDDRFGKMKINYAVHKEPAVRDSFGQSAKGTAQEDEKNLKGLAEYSVEPDAHFSEEEFSGWNFQLEEVQAPVKSYGQSWGKVVSEETALKQDQVGVMNINYPVQEATAVEESFRQSMEENSLEVENDLKGLTEYRLQPNVLFPEKEFIGRKQGVQEPVRSNEKSLTKVIPEKTTLKQDHVGRMSINYPIPESTAVVESFRQSTEGIAVEGQNDLKGLTVYRVQHDAHFPEDFTGRNFQLKEVQEPLRSYGMSQGEVVSEETAFKQDQVGMVNINYPVDESTVVVESIRQSTGRLQSWS